MSELGSFRFKNRNAVFIPASHDSLDRDFIMGKKVGWMVDQIATLVDANSYGARQSHVKVHE